MPRGAGPRSRGRRLPPGSSAPVIQRLGALQAGQFERPARHQLVLLQQAAAHAVAGGIAPVKRLKAAEAARGAGVEGKDGVADDDEAAPQRADRGIERDPVRRARAGRERLDLVAVVLHPRRGTAKALHRLEEPPVRLVAHGGLASEREFRAGGVAVFARRAPAALLEEKGVVYPCTFEWKPSESPGTSE